MDGFNAIRGLSIAIVIIVVLALVVPVAYYFTYKAGRKSMYADLIQATGGQKDSTIQVLTPHKPEKFHKMSTCFSCHK